MRRFVAPLGIIYVLALVLAVTARPASSAQGFDGRQIFRFDTFGDEQLWTNVLRMHEVIRIRQSGDRVGRRPEGRCRRAAARAHRCASGRTGRPDRSRRDDRTAAAERGRRRHRQGRRPRSTRRASASPVRCATRPSTTRSTTGIGRRLDGWPNRDLNVGAISGCRPRSMLPRGRVQHVGAGKVRPAAPCVRRHEHHSAEQSHAAGPHPARVWTAGRGLRDLHRRRTDLVLEQLRRRVADGRPGQLQRSSHRPRRSRRSPIASRRSCRRCWTIS